MKILEIKENIIDKIHKMSSTSRFVVTLLFALFITTITGLITQQVVVSRAEQQFEKDSSQIKITLNNTLKRYSDLLVSMHSFVGFNNGINKKQFDKYTDSLYLTSQYPAVNMIDFMAYVKANELDKFYDAISKEYKEENPYLYEDIDNTINENAIKKGKSINVDRYIIKYVSPIDEAYPYIGLDLGANPIMKKELENSKLTKTITSSGKIYISKKDGAFPFIRMHLATFKETDNKDIDETYYGSVGVSLRLDKNLFGGLNSNLNYIDFQIFSPEEDGRALIYDSRYDRKNVDMPWPKHLFNDKLNKFIIEDSFKLGKRDFFIKTFSTTLPPNLADMGLVFFVMFVTLIIMFAGIHFIIFKKIEYQAVSERAEKRANHLEKQANTDELTGLLNRRAFFTDLEDRIEKYKENPHVNMFLFFIDLDGFKRVNDTLGHTAGDIVLKEYAARLKLFAKIMPCRYYRIGGDEFTVFIENNPNEKALTLAEIEGFAKSLLSLTDSPFQVRDEEFLLTQSIGIAEYPSDGITPEELFKNSDMAMYEAKRKGKNCYLFFSKRFSEEVEKRNQILNLLSTAIDRNEFHLEFQPKMTKENDTYVIKGVETLLRWNNCKLGSVSPAVFIPLAEDAGLMPKIGNWLITEVAKTIHNWRNTPLEQLKVAINISAKQFTNETLPYYYESVLSQYNINPERIIIEITESAMMKEPQKTKEILLKFREYGFGVSVDDFGTGHSSLSYLRQFPVTEIKIDKSFTDDILIDEHDRIIIEGIINMSQKLNLVVVVEGVESLEQVQWLEEHSTQGVKIQGYYFSKPLKEDILKEFVNNNIGSN